MGGKNSNILNPAGISLDTIDNTIGAPLQGIDATLGGDVKRSILGGKKSGGKTSSHAQKELDRTQGRADAFIKSLNENESISDITRSELTAKFATRESRLQEDIDSLTGPGGKGLGFGSNSNIGKDSGAFLQELEDEFYAASTGTETKFKVRQTAQRSAELRADRPGILQTRTTKNRPTGGGPTGTPTPIAKRSNK